MSAVNKIVSGNTRSSAPLQQPSGARLPLAAEGTLDRIGKLSEELFHGVLLEDDECSTHPSCRGWTP